MKAGKKRCIPNALDETDVDMLCEKNRNIRSKCEEDEGSDSEDVQIDNG